MKATVMLTMLAVVSGVGRTGGQTPPRPSGPPGPPHQRTWAFAFGNHHGRLGVLVNTRTTPTTDSIGARVEAVTPGGPAAKAGLKAGDVITQFNGTSLAGVPPESEDESGPGRQLVELAQALQPGDSVQLEYRRGAEKRKTTLVAEDVTAMPGMDHLEAVPEPGRMSLLGPDGGMSFCFGDAWCNMELVSLNPDLGEYFGTKEGILVVKAPADSSLPLKSGDVILAIGGRKPASASHAMRILRSYDVGETVVIDIMRKQKRSSITWHVPRMEDHMRRFMRFRQMAPDSDDDPPPPER